jgi:3',5'-cyclic AMP phosphodiesterase CpdA
MTTIVHLSDLHFGTEDPAVLAGLVQDIERTASLVAISGDLTQRATEPQFRAARKFLDELPVPYIVVPGNHDVPLYNVFARLFKPLGRYRRYISQDLMPRFFTEDVAVVGLTTAHGLTAKGGKITREMADRACAAFSTSLAPWKVIVAHHPFVIPHGVHDVAVVGIDEELPRLEACGVDAVLTGHLHVAHATDEAGFRSDDHRVIAVTAGTAISRRTRGEPNGYNWIAIDGDTLSVVHRVWDGTRFVDAASKVYRRTVRDGDVQIAKLDVRLAPVTTAPRP